MSLVTTFNECQHASLDDETFDVESCWIKTCRYLWMIKDLVEKVLGWSNCVTATLVFFLPIVDNVVIKANRVENLVQPQIGVERFRVKEFELDEIVTWFYLK